MADIPGVIDKMNDIEIAFDASLSEQLMNKFGANINALIDLSTSAVFTSSDTYDIPLNATKLLVLACGAGGGGASGGSFSSGPILNFGASGGHGCLLSTELIDVTGGETATITIGTGGTGGAAAAGGNTPGANGVNGGDTTLTNATDGTRTWFGGRGGIRMSTIVSVAPIAYAVADQRLVPRAGYHTSGGLKISGQGVVGNVLVTPQAGIFAGGSTGSDSGANRMAGGGGGGSSFGIGGSGSSGTVGTSSAGGDAAATSYGAGGGASGIGITGTGKGGDGAQGFLFILRALA